MTILRVIIVFAFSILLICRTQAQVVGYCPSNQTSQAADIKQDSANPFPNELEGFRFFSEGKLSVLRLGVSTSQDVEKVFGAPFKIDGNTKSYDYDPYWIVRISYIDAETYTKIIYLTVNGKKITKRFVPLPQFISTIHHLQMIPGPKIPFVELTSPNKFLFTGDLIEYKIYSDGYGLNYWVDYPQNESNGYFKKIVYNIPPAVECKMYVEQN